MVIRRPMLTIAAALLWVSTSVLGACAPADEVAQPSAVTGSMPVSTTAAESSGTASTAALPEPQTTTAEGADLFPVLVEGKWGYIDKIGAIKIDPQFDGIGRPDRGSKLGGFSEGLAAVSISKAGVQKWGYIDRTGTWIVAPQFDYAGSFAEGLAVVGNKTGLDGDLYMKYGYIDPSGTIVIPMERYSASSFSEGLAMFTEIVGGYPSYFLNKAGATVLGPFDLALDFSEGLAYVETEDSCGFIDSRGNRVIRLPDSCGRCQHVSCSFSEGLAAVALFAQETERHGFVDKMGTWAISPRSDYFQDFSEGLAAATVKEAGRLKWGYVDNTGAWVIQPRYEWAGIFSEGLAAAQCLENDVVTYGYIDRTGALVIPPRQCTGAEPFHGGLAALIGLGSSSDLQTPSYIDKTGRVVWEASR